MATEIICGPIVLVTFYLDGRPVALPISRPICPDRATRRLVSRLLFEGARRGFTERERLAGRKGEYVRVGLRSYEWRGRGADPPLADKSPAQDTDRPDE